MWHQEQAAQGIDDSREQRKAELGLNLGARTGGSIAKSTAGTKFKRVKERRQSHWRGPVDRDAGSMGRKGNSPALFSTLECKSAVAMVISLHSMP